MQNYDINAHFSYRLKLIKYTLKRHHYMQQIFILIFNINLTPLCMNPLGTQYLYIFYQYKIYCYKMRNRNNLFQLHFIHIVLFSKCCICTFISKLKICVTLLRFSVILKSQCLQKNSCQIPPDTAPGCIPLLHQTCNNYTNIS